jgi:hypothetical protein
MPVVAFCIRSVVDYAEVLAFGCLGNLPYLAGKIDASGIVVRGGDDRTPYTDIRSEHHAQRNQK